MKRAVGEVGGWPQAFFGFQHRKGDWLVLAVVCLLPLPLRAGFLM